MIDILSLEPITMSKNLKGKFILIYGQPKVGKTSLAAQFPKSLLLAFEPGYNGLINKKVQPISKWAEFKDVIRQLGSDAAKEMYDNIIIDTADIAWDYAEKWVCMQNLQRDKSTGMDFVPKSLADIPYGKGYNACTKEYDDAFKTIASMGYGIVFISHEQAKKSFGAAADEIVKVVPSLNERAKFIISRFVDITAYLKRIHDKEKNTDTRYIYTRDTDFFEAGTRFDYLAPRIEMSYKNLVEAIYEAIDKQLLEENMKDSNELNSFYTVKENRPFAEIQKEAAEVWNKNKSSNVENCKIMNAMIEKIFGAPVKISEASATQAELVEAVIAEWKTIQ